MRAVCRNMRSAGSQALFLTAPGMGFCAQRVRYRLVFLGDPADYAVCLWNIGTFDLIEHVQKGGELWQSLESFRWAESMKSEKT